MPKKNGVVPLMITTAHRGVFFGYGHPSDKQTITVEKARMCVYWDASMKGVLGLATKGPGNACRISQAVPKLTLRDVTAVFETTPEAAEAWEKAPW